MKSAYDSKASMMGAYILPTNEHEALTSDGLVCGHAYSVTKVLNAQDIGNELLVRIRNPWGNEIEWKGAWSDHSTEWNLLTTQQKAAYGTTKENDGEFFMSIRDFTKVCVK